MFFEAEPRRDLHRLRSPRPAKPIHALNSAPNLAAPNPRTRHEKDGHRKPRSAQSSPSTPSEAHPRPAKPHHGLPRCALRGPTLPSIRHAEVFPAPPNPRSRHVNAGHVEPGRPRPSPATKILAKPSQDRPRAVKLRTTSPKRASPRFSGPCGARTCLAIMSGAMPWAFAGIRRSYWRGRIILSRGSRSRRKRGRQASPPELAWCRRPSWPRAHAG